MHRQTDGQTDYNERGGGEREGREGGRERERERTQKSELYYSRIEILGICLFLQSVLANLHANTYTTRERERGRERESVSQLVS